jgi:CCR4-NOT transcription complex subunit 1
LAPLFFRACTELSVDSFNSIKGASAGNPYQAIDAFTRLCVLLIKLSKEKEGQVNFAVKIFSVIVLVLIHSQEINPNDFDQKPFLRIFSSILNDLSIIEMSSQNVYQNILVSIWFAFI